jgi:hypothetical protein
MPQRATIKKRKKCCEPLKLRGETTDIVKIRANTPDSSISDETTGKSSPA